MKYTFVIAAFIFLSSCVKVEDNSINSSVKMNSESEEISFMIDLEVNSNSTEDLNQFVKEITENVIKTEDFCLYIFGLFHCNSMFYGDGAESERTKEHRT